MGYSPQGCKESDTTERLDFSSCTPKEGRRVGQMWRKKPDTWLEDPEELPYINDFATSLLLSSSLMGDTHTLLLWLCISALPLS